MILHSLFEIIKFINAPMYFFLSMEIRFVRKLRDIKATSYARIMLAEVLIDGKRDIVVLKRVIDKIHDGSQSFHREVDAMQNNRHPNVLELIGYSDTEDEKFIYMPFFDGETVKQRVERDGEMGLDEALPFFEQWVSALELVHSDDRKPGYVHYDISGSNFLIDSNGRTVLIDFGTAFRIGNKIPGVYRASAVGTAGYMPPEKLRKLPQHGKESDVYALGVLMYFALSGRLPFYDDNRRSLKPGVVSEKPVPLRSGSKAVDDVVLKCLSAEAESRPSAKELSQILN